MQIVVDALNLAYWSGNPPSLRVPLAVLRALLQAEHSALLCFDASAPYRLTAELEVYQALIRDARWALEVPAGRPADRELLRQATRMHSCVLSRDHFRDHRKRYRRLIDDPARCLTGFVREGEVLLPQLGLAVPLPASATEAWAMLTAPAPAAQP